ncbi:MAG: hypothetical protein HDR11_16920 [Lachnospiraceae bacterium]|nr:hypothetical protein [Lachnospiraceae bacterium]MBD5499401.1 hypothetical protein [Lachnospiraceae bacterium]MBD5512662.1 hypothetical protein [Lachnospiraceae bacterium]
MGRKKNYIFTNKKHSERAIMSTILGVISLASFVAVIYLAYAQAGNIPPGYGITGFLVAVFSIIGLVLGIMTVVEKDRYKLFPCLGIFFNLLALLGIGFVVYAGMYL